MNPITWQNSTQDPRNELNRSLLTFNRHNFFLIHFSGAFERRCFAHETTKILWNKIKNDTFFSFVPIEQFYILIRFKFMQLKDCYSIQPYSGFSFSIFFIGLWFLLLHVKFLMLLQIIRPTWDIFSGFDCIPRNSNHVLVTGHI